MAVRAIDDKPSDTLVVVSGEGFWTGSSTLPHLHHSLSWRRRRLAAAAAAARMRRAAGRGGDTRLDDGSKWERGTAGETSSDGLRAVDLRRGGPTLGARAPGDQHSAIKQKSGRLP
jgi:hypothetical protein